MRANEQQVIETNTLTADEILDFVPPLILGVVAGSGWCWRKRKK